MTRAYQICVKCVMDTSDRDIKFNNEGICSHCQAYSHIAQYYENNDKIEGIRDRIIKKIRKDGHSKDYDCIIGVSGGVDSSYLAYIVKKLGLRPLAVHLDNGWDSELAVNNIEKLLKKLEIDLYTYVLDWEEFRDLQLAFLKSSTPDSEIPTDHAIVALLYNLARENDIKYIIIGTNYKTESHLPRSWSQGHGDWVYINGIHKKFGKMELTTFPHYSPYVFLKNIAFGKPAFIPLLDYINYNKQTAMEILLKELEWKSYGGKHYESIYTKFYQGYILPKKFGFDKRRTHLSSLICSGEITRDNALKELEQQPYTIQDQENDKDYVIKKLGITNSDFEKIMKLPLKTYWDYPHSLIFNPLVFRIITTPLFIWNKISNSFY